MYKHKTIVKIDVCVGKFVVTNKSQICQKHGRPVGVKKLCTLKENDIREKSTKKL